MLIENVLVLVFDLLDWCNSGVVGDHLHSDHVSLPHRFG